MTGRPDPYLVECPKCGAKPRFGCTTATGFAAVTHAARWAAIGIPKPTLEQRTNTYELFQKHRLALTTEARAAWKRRDIGK